jgi:hypothetical protein
MPALRRTQAAVPEAAHRAMAAARVVEKRGPIAPYLPLVFWPEFHNLFHPIPMKQSDVRLQ